MSETKKISTIRRAVTTMVFPVLLLLLTVTCSKPGTDEMNVIFISMDTTRADFIDTGKSARAYTPEIKRFAKKAAVFERAFTTIPLTLPSHLSILTACLPQELGVIGNEYLYDGTPLLLQEVLRDKGYHTAGIVSLGTLSSRTGIDKGFNEFYEDLFEDKVFFVPAEKITAKAIEVVNNAAAIKRDDGSGKNKNFFLFLHYSDPHTPYAPPGLHADFEVLVDGKTVYELNAYHGAILRLETPLAKGIHTVEFKLAGSMDDFNTFVIRRLEFGTGKVVSLRNLTFSEEHYGGSYLLDQPYGAVKVKCSGDTSMTCFQVIPLVTTPAAARYYREEVEYMDKQIGKFLAYLETSKLLEKTVVVLFADHGEGLGERDNYFGHTRYLNQQFIQVPMILYLPGMKKAAKHIQVPVSTAALSPTVLEFLGIQHPQFDRRPSLLPLIENEGKKVKSAPVYSFTYAPEALRDKFSVIRWPYQGIFYLATDTHEPQGKEYYNLSMWQSYNHKDALFPDLVKKNAIQHYRFFLQDYAQTKRAFNRNSINGRKMLADNQTLERLSALGYLR